MAFPTTGIIDNFNRANEGPPLSASWTDLDGGHQVVGNACENSEDQEANNICMYNVATYGPDCEVYATIVTHYIYGMALILRGTTLVLGTWDGYVIYADTSNDDLEMYRIDDNAWTQLGADVAFTWADGDKIGGEAIGGTIKGYIKDGAAAWAEKISRDDATYGDAGYLGLRSQTQVNENVVYDDFGGGTIAGAAVMPVFDYYYNQARL